MYFTLQNEGKVFQFSVLESCGIPRKEVRVVALSGFFFFDFPPLLFPAHSLFDKGGEGMMEEPIRRARGLRSVDTNACLCACAGSVSEVAFSPPRLSLITPLTPQEALDVRLTS